MNKARSNRLFFVGMVLNFSKFATDISKFATGTVANFEKFETIPKKLWSIRKALIRIRDCTLSYGCNQIMHLPRTNQTPLEEARVPRITHLYSRVLISRRLEQR